MTDSNFAQSDKKSAQQSLKDYNLPIHPWRRYWARWIDIFLGGIVFYALFYTLIPNGFFTDPIAKVLEIILQGSTWFLFEPFFISKWGTTPGKRLFGITVVHPNNQNLSLQESIGRTFQVWMRGLAFSIPIICIGTILFSYIYLKKYRYTYWDKKYNVILKVKEMKIPENTIEYD